MALDLQGKSVVYIGNTHWHTASLTTSEVVSCGGSIRLVTTVGDCLTLDRPPDIVVVEMPVIDVTQIAKLSASSRVIVVSKCDSDDAVKQARDAGALGYLIEDQATPEEISRILENAVSRLQSSCNP